MTSPPIGAPKAAVKIGIHELYEPRKTFGWVPSDPATPSGSAPPAPGVATGPAPSAEASAPRGSSRTRRAPGRRSRPPGGDLTDRTALAGEQVADQAHGRILVQGHHDHVVGRQLREGGSRGGGRRTTRSFPGPTRGSRRAGRGGPRGDRARGGKISRPVSAHRCMRSSPARQPSKKGAASSSTGGGGEPCVHRELPSRPLVRP